MNITIAEQLRCVERELKMRQRVYPVRVLRGLMLQKTADHEIAAMTAVLHTLQQVEQPGLGLFNQEPQ